MVEISFISLEASKTSVISSVTPNTIDSLFSLFEIINEPHGMTKENVDELNFDILQIIRIENPQRIVIYGGYSWSNSDHLLQAEVLDDPFIIGYFHSYDPWEFAGKGNGIWGSEYDINQIKTKFKTVADWSNTHNIPVIISEFGAIHDCDYNSRMLHYFTYVRTLCHVALRCLVLNNFVS